MDNATGLNCDPTDYVDISETLLLRHQRNLRYKEKKCFYATRVNTSVKEHDNIDVVGFTQTLSAFRGMQCSAPFAEAFARWDVWGRTPTTPLLP